MLQAQEKILDNKITFWPYNKPVSYLRVKIWFISYFPTFAIFMFWAILFCWAVP